MVKIGLIREGKIPADNRVALTPPQCKWIHKNSNEIKIIVEASPTRCYTDKEYESAGVEITNNLNDCDILLGIKEVPIEMLIPNKTYLFFSHTKKKQPYNQAMFRKILEKKITLIDYECLTHDDGQRILGFGFFAGVVGGHNGIMAYGKRTGQYDLGRVYVQKNLQELVHTYFGLKLPPIKVAVTGSGRVAHGILEVMNLLGIIEVEPDVYLQKEFAYPVFTHLKGADLYRHKSTGVYIRENFHENPAQYDCIFQPYTKATDILMNGIYWDTDVPRLFEWEELAKPDFRIQTIADITDDKNGSIPCNLGDHSMEDPVYGVDKISRNKTAPYLKNSVDIMAVGNLPNELPRDASRYFGEQLIKYILEELMKGGSVMVDRATIVKNGKITATFDYLKEYGGV
ncbi:MAG: alanine dehydrogenase [Bacteroidetes bacterium]|nr:MAG: alanine dehydrogenase [Bacteroidota bacterium]